MSLTSFSNILLDVPDTAQHAPYESHVAFRLQSCFGISKGKEPISLEDNEFAINCNSYLVGTMYYHMENNQSITLNGKEYQLGIHKLLQETLSTRIFIDRLWNNYIT